MRCGDLHKTTMTSGCPTYGPANVFLRDNTTPCNQLLPMQLQALLPPPAADTAPQGAAGLPQPQAQRARLKTHSNPEQGGVK